MKSVIQTLDLKKNFGDFEALKGVNLDIKSGEVVSVTGASGAGKTTLLQILGTLEKPSSGKIFFGETSIETLSDKALSSFRNQSIGFIFQFHQLLPEFTALENVCIPAFIGKKSKTSTEKKAKELLSYLGLNDRLNNKPNELSGGEQQRTAVARALINEPEIVFADEPSGNLDSANAEQLHQLFFKLREEFGQTFVIVTHNDELSKMADRTIQMQDGKIIE